MSAIRSAASRLLHAVVRHSSGETRSWGHAMLREMDCVEGDWSAFFWALGSTTVLCRLSVAQQLKRLPGLLSGVAAAGAVLTVCLLALSSLNRAPWFEPTRARLGEPLLIVVIPEAVYVVSAAAFWRQRRPLALGILAAGVTLITHAIVHFANHG
jgi:hypothetical protein